MEKETQTIQEQKKYGDTPVRVLEEWIQDDIPEKKLPQTLKDGEKMTVEYGDLGDDNRYVEEKIDELTDSLKSIEESEEQKNSEWLDPEKIAKRLELALCYAYDVYLGAKEDGEHCPTISVGDYVFAARGFTCGHVDRVKVFKKIDKKVLFIFKKKEYVPVEVTMDIVNILAEAGGVLPPLDYETLQKL